MYTPLLFLSFNDSTILRWGPKWSRLGSLLQANEAYCGLTNHIPVWEYYSSVSLNRLPLSIDLHELQRTVFLLSSYGHKYEPVSKLHHGCQFCFTTHITPFKSGEGRLRNETRSPWTLALYLTPAECITCKICIDVPWHHVSALDDLTWPWKLQGQCYPICVQ